MKEERITCDGCGTDLTITGNSIAWRLALTPQKIPCHSGAVTDMWIEPDLDRAHHFCGLRCLFLWVDRYRSDHAKAKPATKPSASAAQTTWQKNEPSTSQKLLK